jgi:hypothetical protein
VKSCVESPDIERLVEIALEMGYPKHISNLLSENDICKFQDLFIKKNPEWGYHIAKDIKDESMADKARRPYAESNPDGAFSFAEQEKDKKLLIEVAKAYFKKKDFSSAYAVASLTEDKCLIDKAAEARVKYENVMKILEDAKNHRINDGDLMHKVAKKLIKMGKTEKAKEAMLYAYDTEELGILLGYKYFEKGDFWNAYFHSGNEEKKDMILLEKSRNALIETDFKEVCDRIEGHGWGMHDDVLRFMVAEELFDKGEVERAYNLICYFDNEFVEEVRDAVAKLNPDRVLEDFGTISWTINDLHLAIKSAYRFIELGELKKAEDISNEIKNEDLTRKIRDAYTKLDSKETLYFASRTKDKELLVIFANREFETGEFFESLSHAEVAGDKELVRKCIEEIIKTDPLAAYNRVPKEEKDLVDKARDAVFERCDLQRSVWTAEQNKDNLLLGKCGRVYLEKGDLEKASSIAYDISDEDLIMELGKAYFEKGEYKNAATLANRTGDKKTLFKAATMLFEKGEDILDAYFAAKNSEDEDLLKKVRKAFAEQDVKKAREVAGGYYSGPENIDRELFREVAKVYLKKGELAKAFWNSFHAKDEQLKENVLAIIAEQKGVDVDVLRDIYP